MSLLRCKTIYEHNYSRTGDFVCLGILQNKEEALRLKFIEEEYMFQRLYRGILVDAKEAVSYVFMQDCTRIRQYNLGLRCRYFAHKTCSYDKDIVKISAYTIT